MDEKWMHLEALALPGIFLLLLYRQKGLRSKLAKEKG